MSLTAVRTQVMHILDYLTPADGCLLLRGTQTVTA